MGEKLNLCKYDFRKKDDLFRVGLGYVMCAGESLFRAADVSYVGNNQQKF